MTAPVMPARTEFSEFSMSRHAKLFVAKRIRRTTACDFRRDEPFIFRANANPEKVAWTPALLREKLGVKDFGRMIKVHVMLNGHNDEDVCTLVSWWTEYGYPVAIKFPVVVREPVIGTPDSPFCFGIERGAAYAKVNGGWQPTTALVQKVLEFFADNHLVIVN